MEQVVFDLDLDFFLDRTSSEAVDALRPEDNEYKIWRDDEIDAFLRNRLGLSEEHRPLAFRCETHDEVLYACLRLCAEGFLQTPFRLLHVDAHDDLDQHKTAIDVATTYYRTRKQPVIEILEGNKSINEANYVCYMLALGMLSEYDFVHLEDSILPQPPLLKADRKHISIDVLKEPYWKYGEEVEIPKDEIWSQLFPDDKNPFMPMQVGDDQLIENDVRARYRHYLKGDLLERAKPSFLFVSRSPKYTPPKADRLIEDCIAPFVDFEAGERLLKGLGQGSKFQSFP